MPFNYNPQDKVDSGGRAEPGEYRFRVEEAAETVFRSGNEGLTLKLAVAAFPEKDITVFARFVYTPKALWRLEQFMAAVGVDFANPGEPHGLIGKSGKATFVVGENGYLEVDNYLPANANNGPDTRRAATKTSTRAPARGAEPPPHGDDDVPW